MLGYLQPESQGWEDRAEVAFGQLLGLWLCMVERGFPLAKVCCLHSEAVESQGYNALRATWIEESSSSVVGLAS